MSLAVRVIPCLDVDAGRVVKGVHFENLRDAGDPVELAAEYYRQGADELTFLDVTASSSHRQTMVDVVSRTAEQIFIPLTVGGGVRTPEDVDSLLRCGADKVGVNTAAIRCSYCPLTRVVSRGSALPNLVSKSLPWEGVSPRALMPFGGSSVPRSWAQERFC